MGVSSPQYKAMNGYIRFLPKTFGELLLFDFILCYIIYKYNIFVIHPTVQGTILFRLHIRTRFGIVSVFLCVHF